MSFLLLMQRFFVLFAGVVMIAASAGCEEDKQGSDGETADSGTDSGSDTDTDTDTDSDSDSDSDSDTSGMGCYLDGECFDDGDQNPDNPCQVCDVGVDSTVWTSDDTAICNDEYDCNGAETCQGGVCKALGGSMCPDDGLFCNGLEFCHSGSCFFTSWDPCDGIGTCDEAEDRCCIPDHEQVCLLEVAQVLDSCGNVTSSFDCATIGQTCAGGMCTCPSGWSGEACDRCVIYVDGLAGSDSSDGTSWANAMATVQAGLFAAVTNTCEVWVTGGTYHPTGGTDRTATIQLQDGIALYGGFYGDEVARTQRDPSSNETILSGDIGVPLDATDNSYHVVTGAIDALLDGFTVSGGYADGSGMADRHGAGMNNPVGPLTVVNCRFENNSSDSYGGAIYNQLSVAMSVRDSVFEGNDASTGSAIGNYGGMGTMVVTNSVFTTNSGLSTVILGNTVSIWSGCVFSQNTGAGLSTSNPSTVIDSIFFDNGGPGMSLDDTGSKVIKTIIEGNGPGLWGGGIALNSDWYSPLVLWDVSVIGNSATRGGGVSVFMEDLYAKNVVFAGNHATEEGGGLYMDGEGMLSGVSFADNTAGISGGAAFVNRDDFLISSSAFANNTAPVDAQISLGAAIQMDPWGMVSGNVIQGGYPGPNNIDASPMFVNSTTAPYNLSLQAGSPCIDAADSNAIPATDIDGNPRVDDPPTPNTGTGAIDYADIGAYEF